MITTAYGSSLCYLTTERRTKPLFISVFNQLDAQILCIKLVKYWDERSAKRHKRNHYDLGDFSSHKSNVSYSGLLGCYVVRTGKQLFSKNFSEFIFRGKHSQKNILGLHRHKHQPCSYLLRLQHGLEQLCTDPSRYAFLCREGGFEFTMLKNVFRTIHRGPCAS